MATFSNNAESKSVLRDVPAANQEQSSPALPLDPAKSAGVNDEDEHIIRKSDSLIGSRL
ncbi:MAG: hypothetical protein LBQ76_00975 [Candidatus Fibromonas sp.]|jgi:hypothetical protein|nr:hypothetical protein [Candidatus Fibromonas sp.]